MESKENKMELNSFGAVMGFAIEVEKKLCEYYQTASDTLKEEVFINLAKEQSKAITAMERTRRENVAEMILVAIQGIREEDFTMDITVPPSAQEAKQKAIALETIAIQFFQLASEKIGVDDVERFFKKLARKRQVRMEEELS